MTARQPGRFAVAVGSAGEEPPLSLEEYEPRVAFPRSNVAALLRSQQAGRPAYQPSTLAAGYYVLGHDGHRWIDALGILVLLSVIVAVSVHGGLRLRQALLRRATPATQEPLAEGESS
mgnify:CR=1 FL=1